MSKDTAKKPVFSELIVRVLRRDVCSTCGKSALSFKGSYCLTCGQLLDFSAPLSSYMECVLDDKALSALRRYAELPGCEVPAMINPDSVRHALSHFDLLEEVPGDGC